MDMTMRPGSLSARGSDCPLERLRRKDARRSEGVQHAEGRGASRESVMSAMAALVRELTGGGV